ncbi:LiaF transmembrane domain-containing protein [Streptococcus pluranimalium]|uniref:LiaF transmembrane domain-containing protein n=1 Tax=Streptococcus pluranimalium TaxID=82348 RepID=UPI0039FCBA4F
MQNQKNTFWGVFLLLLAGFILFKDTLFWIDFSIWKLILVGFIGFATLQNLFRSNVGSTFMGAAVVFMILNSEFNWLKLDIWVLIVATLLGYAGLRLLLPKQSKWSSTVHIHGNKKKAKPSKADSDTVFGGSTRYVDMPFTTIGGDLVFASASVYFSEGTILGDKATYSGDIVFSTLKLYVPQTWSVRMSGDTVMSSLKSDPDEQVSEKILEITGDAVFSRIEIYYL